MVKTLGYCLFAAVYNLCTLAPVRRKNVLCIATHDEGEGSNAIIAARALQLEGYTISYLTKSQTHSVKKFSALHTLLTFFFCKPYEMARAEIVLLDNVFLPYAYLRRRRKQKVIQLWHGTGTIKKFGQDVNQGRLRKLEKRANSNVTHLIVNSEAMKELYSGAFGIEKEMVYSIGLPRTDELLSRTKQTETTGCNSDRERIFEAYQIPKDKKLILYAPTFRDSLDDTPKLMEYIHKLRSGISQDYIIGLRLHPFIAEEVAAKHKDYPSIPGVCQMSFEKDLNALLMACDLLITDYSSVIFEYCLRKKPMIFFAYDYQDFSNQGRGFYYDYETFVPGPVAYTVEELTELIMKDSFDMNRVKAFIEENYSYTDGKATKRLIELIERDVK